MRILIPGLKAWPYHHEVEHFLGEALRAAGHEVLFLGCSRLGMSACECVDRAVREAAGSHAAFCAGCHTRQGGVHQRAGFPELPVPADEALQRELDLLLATLDHRQLLELPVAGYTLRELAGPSLRRWARSGRELESRIPLDVLREHAAQALRLDALLPDLLRRERIDMLLLLNGLFLSERVIAELARSAGLRVVNYERGHARNTFVFSDGQPACYLELDESVPFHPGPDPLAERYLQGRALNRDASTRFGTGAESGGATRCERPLVLVLTNVCWDSAVCSRGDGFGGYLSWLSAVLDEARQRPETDFVLRVHPGEARLQFDPTLDRTEDWLAEQAPPSNLRVVGAEDPESSYELMAAATAGLVYVTSAGLEMAGLGKPVITCGRVHYAGRGFTVDAADAQDLTRQLDQALTVPCPADWGRLARAHAGRLFLDGPTPFPWVDEVEYGRPQRVAAPVTAATLRTDALLARLVDYLVGAAPRPCSLRELLEQPQLCPLPYHFGSRLAADPVRLAVLIPAHQRPDSLRSCLQAWLAQVYPAALLRILVVDDGSALPLEPVLQAVREEASGAGIMAQLELLRLEINGGPARARNAGLRQLLHTGDAVDRILITGDDMRPEPGYLARLTAEHVAWSDPRVAILGRVEWDDSRGITRVMRLVECNGMQFGFQSLPARAWLPAQFFYTCAVALTPAFLLASGLEFAEDFPHAAWEDVEFGVRAMERGLILVHDAAQRLRHDHPTDYAGFARRQRKAGACARVFQARRPREYAAICGQAPVDPPDRLSMRQLEAALGELAKLDLAPLRILPGADRTPDLAGQLDREQDRLLETLFRLHSDAGWFSAPPLPRGPGTPGLLSVLIPVFNQLELTRACLTALEHHSSGPLEIIVVDNASSDGTAEFLAATPHVHVRNERNLGFARASNHAAAAARGEWLLLLNNDTEVLPGWDAALRQELANPATGAVGLRLLYPDRTIQHAGLVFGPDHLPWHVFRGFPAEAPEVMKRRRLWALTGACLGLRRETWQALGGLDENFINCYEDVDLCLRVRALGLDCVYRPDGAVLHHEGRSAGRNERVGHSWLVLQEKWAGQLPHDEDEVLGPEGWRTQRSPGSLSLKRLPPPVLARAPELRRQAEDLLQLGQVEQARELLARALQGAGPAARTGELRRALLELELRMGNLAAAKNWAAGLRPTPRQARELERQHGELARRLQVLGLQVEQ